ncbi:hypothetical protein K450DRAFT_228821 [Umbelopsis ramanniana AG]|uniref:HTH myb-type domain-containing protein n=1 Tax=Umbelopsis ramanniana AG TaxID=1314678 RepID=A0AAD5EDU2_UMBRA|nr:uncharacterized protein K450DRAFT_228821 [Umbelopsis ramanniana AG]KAI8582058.1 hypothetical protein K450DRAFT_228821 [Umbelopsis ramanniana AG]
MTQALDEFEAYVLKAQEEDDISPSESYDELDAMEALIMNVKEEAPESDNETPYGVEDTEDVNDTVEVHAEQQGRFDPYSMSSMSESVQIAISTSTLAGHKDTTHASEYQQIEMEEEEERLDQLLFALSDANGQAPATQSSARSYSPAAGIGATTSSHVDLGEPESSTKNSNQGNIHPSGNEREDSIFEDMPSHQPDAPTQPIPQRRVVKRKLPESSLFDNTRQSHLSTEATSHANEPLFLNNSSSNKKRITDPQEDAVRLTEEDFEKTSVMNEPLATNVKSTALGKIMLSSVRSLPNISVVVGPPDSADEYEWSDSGLTPPTSPEGGAETFPLHISAEARQMTVTEPEPEYIREAIRNMSILPESSRTHVATGNREGSTAAAANATRLPAREASSTSTDLTLSWRPETSQQERTNPPPKVEVHRAPPVNTGARPVKKGSRKVRIPWSTREVDALEAGLEVLGWGQWLAIKKLNYTILKDRDNVAIKDKARNEALRRQKERIPLGPYCGCPFIADA